MYSLIEIILFILIIILLVILGIYIWPISLKILGGAKEPPPPYDLEIVYDDRIIGNNQTLTINETAKQPKLSFNQHISTDKLYTLMMIDLDAPAREWLHWLVVDLPALSVKGSFSVYDGKSLAVYYPPAPPTGSGRHRYIIRLYQQKNLIDMSVNDLNNKRTHFKSHNFAQNHHLKLIAQKQFIVIG
jgi:phosphatidylethanolamine-binding protein (PEBP) family uncharacterized protein